MFKLGKWNFRCRVSRDEWTREPGWYYWNIGAFWLHRRPPDGEMLCRNDYYGFNWTIYFFLPVIFRRLPVRKMPNKQPPKTLVWAGRRRDAEKFLAANCVANAKIITSVHHLRGLRDATLIDLGMHDRTDSTRCIENEIGYQVACGHLTVLSEQEHLKVKAST